MRQQINDNLVIAKIEKKRINTRGCDIIATGVLRKIKNPKRYTF